jgi:hypothetical protein
MHNFVMQLYKGWKLFMIDKFAIVHKMSLLILLKVRFFYWKQRILVPVRPLYSSPKQLFRLSGLNRDSYKVINNRKVRGFYTGVPCSLVLHINLTLTICLPQFNCFYRAFRLPFRSPLYEFGHVIICSDISIQYSMHYNYNLYKIVHCSWYQYTCILMQFVKTFSGFL